MLDNCVTILLIGPVVGWLLSIRYRKSAPFSSEWRGIARTTTTFAKTCTNWTKTLLYTMPRKMGLSRRHKRGTGRNSSTAHKREIAPCNNESGRAGIAASEQLAPAPEPKLDTSNSLIKNTSESTLTPGTVVSFVVILNKNLTISSSNSTRTGTGTTNKQAATRTRTISTRNGSTTRPTGAGTSNSTTDETDETTTVEVEQEMCNYANIDAPKLNKRAFDQTVSGQDRSVSASRKAKSRSTQLIVDAILNSGTPDQQALALRGACLHPKTLSLTKTAGLLPMERNEKLIVDRVKRTIKEVLGSGKRHRVNADRSTFAEILSSSFAGIEATNKEISSLFELSEKSCRRLVKKGEV
jgi:hypothetical protein